MYRCILVPLDGSPFGEQALPHAASIARRTGATLHLTHVHLPPILPSGAETAALPPIWLEMTRDEKRTYLQTLARRVRNDYDVPVETQLMDGGVATALERHAMTCAVGLVVMSTHAHVGLSRLWHHGVADQLSRDLPLPILLIRPAEEELPRGEIERPEVTRLLLPLDGSVEAEGIIRHATRLGVAFGARYTLFRVVQADPGIMSSMLGASEPSRELLHEEQTAARQYLNSVAERMRAGGLEVDTEVVTGDDVPAAVITRVLEGAHGRRPRVDLVAIETHPRSFVARLLFRGTTDGLVKESLVPTLVLQGAPELVTAPVDALGAAVAGA